VEFGSLKNYFSLPVLSVNGKSELYFCPGKTGLHAAMMDALVLTLN
jgi:hypothetical protein